MSFLGIGEDLIELINRTILWDPSTIEIMTDRKDRDTRRELLGLGPDA